MYKFAYLGITIFLYMHILVNKIDNIHYDLRELMEENVIYTETFVAVVWRVYKTHILLFYLTYLVAYVFIFNFFYLTVEFIILKK